MGQAGAAQRITPHSDLRRQPAGVFARRADSLCCLLTLVTQRLLPDGLEVPSAFESVGHIAHLNLRNELLPYKHLIGQVRSVSVLKSTHLQQG